MSFEKTEMNSLSLKKDPLKLAMLITNKNKKSVKKLKKRREIAAKNRSLKRKQY